MSIIYPHQELEDSNGMKVPQEAIADIQIESSYEPLESQVHPGELADSKPVILVTPEQYAWLESVRKKTGKTKSCIMRSLIAEQIAREAREETFLIGYFDGTELLSTRSVTESKYEEELMKADELTGGTINIVKL